MNLDLVIRKRRNEPLGEQDYAEARRLMLAELESLVEFSLVDGATPAERLTRASVDKSYFARTYLPHYYASSAEPDDGLTPQERYKQIPKHERKIFEALGIRNVPVALTAFRAAGKSTDAMVEEIHSALFGTSRFIVHVMDSHDKAQMYTLRILTELQHNKRIIHDFGLCVKLDAGMGDFEIFDAKTGQHRSRIYAMGIKMSIRGLISGNTRPDLVICEDLQNSDTAINPKLTKKLLNKLLADIRFCFDQIRGSWGFIVIGNIICSGSVIDVLMKKATRWMKVVIPVEYYDKAGRRRSIWPEVFPLAKLDEMRADVEVGGDAVYRREMLCQAIELEGEFSESWFRHHKNDLPGLDRKAMIMQIDPSFADHGDYKAMVVGPIYKRRLDEEATAGARDAMGREIAEGEYYVATDVFVRKCSMDKFIRTIYDWNDKYSPVEIRCDGTATQKYFMKRELDRYASLPGYNRLPVKFSDQQQNKDEKIAELEPIVEGGYLLLPPRTSDDVEQLIVQFCRHGNEGMNDDGPDVVAEWIKSLRKRYGSKRKAKVSFL
jgi:hypothetical protein